MKVKQRETTGEFEYFTLLKMQIIIGTTKENESSKETKNDWEF